MVVRVWDVYLPHAPFWHMAARRRSREGGGAHYQQVRSGMGTYAGAARYRVHLAAVLSGLHLAILPGDNECT